MTKIVLLKSMPRVEQPMPVIRPGREYWDHFCALERFSFLKNASEAVVRVPMKGGNWVSFYEVESLIDEMQTEINMLREKLADYNGAV